MASFTSVGDTTALTLTKAGETARVALSGTYNMTIELQREVVPGSGAWRALKQWTTADATVAYDYVAQSDGESLQLIVLVDTSGTCVATLTDNTDLLLDRVLKKSGGPAQEILESGEKRYLGWSWASGGVVNTTAALSLTAAAHANRVVTVNSAAGVTITMPAATGTGDVYTVFCGTTVTSSALKVAALSTDTIAGGVAIATDIAGVVMLAGGTDDYISMNGSTTGGVKGSFVKLTDVASGLWMVEGFLVSTGAEATPFGAT